jgi:hypothetical protein
MQMVRLIPRSVRPHAPRLRHVTLVVAAAAFVTFGGCTRAALVRRADARRLGSELEVKFTKVVDATNRAVLAVTDEESAAAAREAAAAARLITPKRAELHDVLASLGDTAALAQLGDFNGRFAALEKLDAEVLSLAVENTNLKAQRLSFGAARDAAGAFRAAVVAAASANGRESVRANAIAAQAVIAVLDIEVLQGPHIAEPTGTVMSDLEAQMASSAAAARARLDELRRLPGGAAPRLDEAQTALRTFLAVNDEIVALSRRNTNVRSLALALGERRRLTAACDDQLRQLQDSLARAEQTGTR